MKLEYDRIPFRQFPNEVVKSLFNIGFAHCASSEPWWQCAYKARLSLTNPILDLPRLSSNETYKHTYHPTF